MKNGFSLIELCFVLVIVGLLSSTLITYANLYYKEKSRRTTYENLNRISVALGEYYSTFGHYPCPARLTADISGSQFGVETECKAPAAKGGTIMKSAASGVCPDGICTAYGQEGESEGDTIKIGAVPSRALGIPFEDTLDGHGNRITYAVTERYATSDPERHLGAISIHDVSGKSLVDPAGSAQFILISHGPDGRGAYTPAGRPALPCDSGTLDGQNCRNDGLFLDAPYADVMGKNHFDDVVLYKMFGNSMLWESSPSDNRNIYNTTLGNVGIGTREPRQKLDIAGNVRAIGDSYVTRICDEGGKDCFAPALIGGTGMHCSESNTSMIGIRDGKPVCATLTVDNPHASQCPQNSFMVGFSLTGDVLCREPAWTATQDNTVNVTP